MRRHNIYIYTWAYIYKQQYLIMSSVQTLLCQRVINYAFFVCVWYITLFVSVACRLVSFLCLF